MRTTLGIGAVLAAAAALALAFVAGGAAFAVGSAGGLPPGQVRGLLFTLAMLALAAGLLRVAAGSFGRVPRGRGPAR